MFLQFGLINYMIKKSTDKKKDKPEKNSKNVDEGTVKLEPGLKL